MVELGGPVIPGKAKEAAKHPLARVKVAAISGPLLADKLKYQDLPMLVVLVLHLLASLGSGVADPASRTIGLTYIGVTLASLLSGAVSSRWPRDNGGVELGIVVAAVQDR